MPSMLSAIAIASRFTQHRCLPYPNQPSTSLQAQHEPEPNPPEYIIVSRAPTTSGSTVSNLESMPTPVGQTNNTPNPLPVKDRPWYYSDWIPLVTASLWLFNTVSFIILLWIWGGKLVLYIVRARTGRRVQQRGDSWLESPSIRPQSPLDIQTRVPRRRAIRRFVEAILCFSCLLFATEIDDH